MQKKSYLKIKETYLGSYGFAFDIVLFSIITYGFHIIFKLYTIEIMSIPVIHQIGIVLTDWVYNISLWFNVKVLRLNIVSEPINTMWFNNGGYITINSSCSGLKQFYQVIVLFLLFPGPWKHKLWFIPFGIFVMFLTNIFRIVSLSLILLWQPKYWDFSHDWILRPFFYVVLFGLWIIWVEKFVRKTYNE